MSIAFVDTSCSFSVRVLSQHLMFHAGSHLGKIDAGAMSQDVQFGDHSGNRSKCFRGLGALCRTNDCRGSGNEKVVGLGRPGSPDRATRIQTQFIRSQKQHVINYVFHTLLEISRKPRTAKIQPKAFAWSFDIEGATFSRYKWQK